ncbi:MAG: hypothetical protein QM779_12215 [Propionicimonas sp.]|uniref:hypothetical protein n=1 Tax=Propionicimonas sp. TaxID=1955623 RepID=UPI003D0B8FC2
MHQVRQRPPLRALALAAVMMLVGVLVILMAELLESNVWLLAAGLIVVGAGLGLFGASVWVARATRVHAVLDEDGYVLQGREATESGLWADVVRVTRGVDRISIHHKDGTRVQLVVARGAMADLDALGEDISRRLDANRGYGA